MNSTNGDRCEICNKKLEGEGVAREIGTELYIVCTRCNLLNEDLIRIVKQWAHAVCVHKEVQSVEIHYGKEWEGE